MEKFWNLVQLPMKWAPRTLYSLPLISSPQGTSTFPPRRIFCAGFLIRRLLGDPLRDININFKSFPVCGVRKTNLKVQGILSATIWWVSGRTSFLAIMRNFPKLFKFCWRNLKIVQFFVDFSNFVTNFLKFFEIFSIKQ